MGIEKFTLHKEQMLELGRHGDALPGGYELSHLYGVDVGVGGIVQRYFPDLLHECGILHLRMIVLDGFEDSFFRKISV